MHVWTVDVCVCVKKSNLFFFIVMEWRQTGWHKFQSTIEICQMLWFTSIWCLSWISYSEDLKQTRKRNRFQERGQFIQAKHTHKFIYHSQWLSCDWNDGLVYDIHRLYVQKWTWFIPAKNWNITLVNENC